MFSVQGVYYVVASRKQITNNKFGGKEMNYRIGRVSVKLMKPNVDDKFTIVEKDYCVVVNYKKSFS